MAHRDPESSPNSKQYVDKNPEAVNSFVQRNAGLLLITASQGFFASMNVAFQVLNRMDPPVPIFEIILVRMAITYVCSVGYMMYAGIPDPWIGPKGVRFLLLIRGFLGFTGLFTLYNALHFLSLSDATVLTFLTPPMTGIVGYFFIREPFTVKQAFASVFSLTGVVLIARPAFLFGIGFPALRADGGEERVTAVIVTLLGVCATAGGYVSIRAIGKRAHPMHAMVFYSGQCVIGSAIGMYLPKTPYILPTEARWVGLLITVGIFGFIAQLLLTMGLQRETVARGIATMPTQIIFAVTLELMIFGTLPSILSVLGAIIIVSSALFVALSRLENMSPAPPTPTSAIPTEDETTSLLRGAGNSGRPYV